jgi:16S rRNA (guanine527-N7)-methyltransferase
MSREEFAESTGVSRETLERLDAYVGLLTKWQRRINLVSRASLADVWRRHILDSAQVMDFLPATPGRILDLGSGAGFPGLVLAILGADGVELVESDGRKCAFLAEAARISGVSVKIHNKRIEALEAEPADVITARACAPLVDLLSFAARFWGPHTRMIALKGADVDEELTDATKCWRISVDRHPSRSDPNGTVLCLGNLDRASSR